MWVAALLLFPLLYSIPLHEYTNLFIHPTRDGHLGHFPFFSEIIAFSAAAGSPSVVVMPKK